MVFYLVEVGMKITQSLVDAAIDAASYNGFGEPKPKDVLELAVDMVLYCSDFQMQNPEVLEPFIIDYIKRHPKFFIKLPEETT